MSKLSNERMEKNKITVEEALAKLNSGHSLDRYSIDFADTGIEALDVMKLAKAGKTVPESLVFYSDEDIEDDEDFAGNWREIDVDPVDEQKRNTQMGSRAIPDPGRGPT